MNDQVIDRHADFCRTFSNSKRLKILCLLKEGEKTAGEITRELGIAKANTSQHLGLMRDMNILKTRRSGVNIYYSIANKKISQACSLMQEALSHVKREPKE